MVKKKSINITTWSVIAVVVVFMAVNVVLGLVLTNQSRTDMKTLIDNHMLDVANTSAAMIDGDVLERITDKDKGTPEYDAIFNTLTLFQNNIELEYIYALRGGEFGSFYCVIDPAIGDDLNYGETVPLTKALQEASKGTPSVDQEPYTDRFGRFYSAYSPVFNSKGEVVGAIAADFDAGWYDSQVNESTWTVLLGTLASLVLGVLLILLATNRIRKRFDALTSELGDLAVAVDDLAHEMSDEGAIPLPDDGEEEEHSADIVIDLEHRIHAMGESLQHYLDSMHSQTNSMITALSSVYRGVYYIDLDKDEAVCYQAHKEMEGGMAVGEVLPYLETFRSYAHTRVMEDNREEFLRFIEPESIREQLANNRVISCLYLANHDGRESYEMLRMAGVRHPEDRDDHIVHAVGAGFTDVDADTRQTIARNEALSDALTVAEEASKAKTVFLSSMSHEIRTPMNAIIGLDRIALNEPDISDRTRENLQKIGDSANHLLQLINDILDMSRIESGRMTIHNEDFCLRDVLDQVGTIIGEQCREKGLNYRFELKGTLDDYYLGDETKLRQVLINILGNAVKFTPEGGDVCLIVERTARYEGKSTIRFIMKDSGIGISEEFLPKIFDAFSQEDSMRANKYGSTGLGMPITKNIVEMMNGTINVESEKDVGTTFYVSITFDDSDRTFLDDDFISPQEMHVLIVDDDSVSSEHSAFELRGVGISSDIANSGEEALEMVQLQHARRSPYNLILVAWKMSEMDGVETARRIRSIVGDESAIILLTSSQWDEVEDEARASGVDEFLSKPLSGSHAIEALRQVLRRQTEGGARKEKAELAGRRVLLAEDIELNAEILIDILDLRDIEAEHAENGQVAVEMFASKPEGYYDAVLMDMRMPVMDGLEATAAIRALDRPDAQLVPIIALTANAFDEDVQRSLQMGLNAHLSKPVDPDVLFETLEGLIRD